MEKAVIFDLDGTLLHTLPDIVVNVNAVLTQRGKPIQNAEQVTAMICDGARELMAKAFNLNVDEPMVDEVLNEYLDRCRISTNDLTTMYDGMKEVLLALRERGYKVCIVTNKSQINLEGVYEKHLSWFNFDEVIGVGGNIKKKPDPMATLNLLSKLNCSPTESYFIGDGETDVKTALACNLNCICALWGYRTKEQLQKVGGAVFASTPTDLLTLIK